MNTQKPYFCTYPDCGAHLDPGEKCDCRGPVYVRPPENHIVIDFDLKDDNKSGAGVHLHYIYDGDAQSCKTGKN